MYRIGLPLRDAASLLQRGKVLQPLHFLRLSGIRILIADLIGSRAVRSVPSILAQEQLRGVLNMPVASMLSWSGLLLSLFFVTYICIVH
jgi:hypothetical protein